MAKMSMTKPMKIGQSTSKGAPASGLQCVESAEWAYSRWDLISLCLFNYFSFFKLRFNTPFQGGTRRGYNQVPGF